MNTEERILPVEDFVLCVEMTSLRVLLTQIQEGWALLALASLCQLIILNQWKKSSGRIMH